MNKNKILKYLIPIVAVVVLVESVVLINGLKNRNKEVEPVVPVSQEMDVQKSTKPVAFDLLITGDQEMKLGMVSKMEVKATSLTSNALDSVNVYLKYDPMAFDLDKLVFDDKLPEPTFSKISTAKGLVVVNFLISEPDGVRLNQGEMLSLVSFEAKPKKAGNYVFEISTGNEMKESATMFVENATSEILPFTSNKLTVNVVR